MNDEPHRVEELSKAVTLPLQSDTQKFPLSRTAPDEIRGAFRHGHRRGRSAAILALLFFFLLLPALANVCLTPCDSKCPKANGTPVCEPVSFSADAQLAETLLALGETTNSTVTATNLEGNLLISCTYSVGGVDMATPVPLEAGAGGTLGIEPVTAPDSNPGYQQLVQVYHAVRCSSRIINASAAPESDYLWCGAGCIEFSRLYLYPTTGEVDEYQEAKLNASNALSNALKALNDARTILLKAEATVAAAQTAGVDTSYAEYKLMDANLAFSDATAEYSIASYAFDQSDFDVIYPHIGEALFYASRAYSLANEAYGSLVYTGSTKSYVGWYVNTTGIMINEIGDLINTLEPIADGPLGGAIPEWKDELAAAEGLFDQAKDRLAEGDEAGAMGLLAQARQILLNLKRKMEALFDTIYNELLKAALNGYDSAKAARDNLERLVNSTVDVKGVTGGDFTRIREGIGKADGQLGKALESIRAAENSTTTSAIRGNVNAALIKVANARVELAIAASRYRIATFKTDTLVTAMTILSAMIAFVIIGLDLRDEMRRRRLEGVRASVLGEPLTIKERRWRLLKGRND